MVMSVDTDTYAALQQRRLEVRYMLRIEGKDRGDGSTQAVNIWNGDLTEGIPLLDPKDFTVKTRTYQSVPSLKVPSIPQKLELEARSIRLIFSRLPAPVVNAIRTYDPKRGDVQIHRALFDPASGNIVAPAYCLFAGFVNKAPIKVPKSGGEGTVELECSSYSRLMTKIGGAKYSDEFLKTRSGDRFGRYLDVSGIWRIFWGEEEKSADEHLKKPEKWYRPK